VVSGVVGITSMRYLLVVGVVAAAAFFIIAWLALAITWR
jgi:hypothetical protein